MQCRCGEDTAAREEPTVVKDTVSTGADRSDRMVQQEAAREARDVLTTL